MILAPIPTTSKMLSKLSSPRSFLTNFKPDSLEPQRVVNFLTQIVDSKLRSEGGYLRLVITTAPSNTPRIEPF